MDTLYDLLGVTPSVDETELRNAFRSRARELHPDRGGPGDGRAMAELNAAWAILGDPQRRRDYDATLTPVADETSDEPLPRPSRREAWVGGIRFQVLRLGAEAAHAAALTLSMKRRGADRHVYESLIPEILDHLALDTEERLRAARRAGAAPLDLGMTATLLGVRSMATELARRAQRRGRVDTDDLHLAEMLDRMWDTIAHELRFGLVNGLGGNPHVRRWLVSR